MEALHFAREFLFWGTVGLVMAGLLIHQVILFQAARRDDRAIQRRMDGLAELRKERR